MSHIFAMFVAKIPKPKKHLSISDKIHGFNPHLAVAHNEMMSVECDEAEGEGGGEGEEEGEGAGEVAEKGERGPGPEGH